MVIRRWLWLFVAVSGVGAFSGCSLFAPRYVVYERRTHVIIVGLGPVAPAAITPTGTPNLHLFKADGAYTADLRASDPASRRATFGEVLTGLPPAAQGGGAVLAAKALPRRVRSAGRTAVSMVRSPDLAVFDPAALRLGNEVDSPEALGALAAQSFVRLRPDLMFVELGLDADSADACDAGLGHILAGVREAGLSERTTVFVVSAGSPPLLWMVRGPGTRHGYPMAEVVSAVDISPTVAGLLAIGTGETSGKKVENAFRALSEQPPTGGERVVPRGSIRGHLVNDEGRPMAKASMLLVRDEPPDGIRERWAETDAQGRFRYDSIPAGRYDYAFAFDNRPATLRRSLLVARDLIVRRDETIDLKYRYLRMKGDDASAPAVPPAEDVAAFLTDRQLRDLAEAAFRGTAPWPGDHAPTLLADALTGRRVRSTLVREWMLAKTAALRTRMAAGVLDDAARGLILDLAAAYDINRVSGLLSDTETRDLLSALSVAAGLLSGDPSPGAYLPLGMAAAVLGPSPGVSRWWSRADAGFAAHLKAVLERAEERPSALDQAALCRILQYAMLRRATGGKAIPSESLERLVTLALACLTPEQRRVAPHARVTTPDATLGFLGLAKTAYADQPLGGELSTAWELVGAPFWAPQADESVLGIALTAAAQPERRPISAVHTRRLTDTAAVLSDRWGSDAEWMAVVSGWTIEVHAGAARLARLETSPMEGEPATTPQILRLISTPAGDYLLLGGWVVRSGATTARQAVYRHVLFNKLTGYLLVSDEFPAGFVTRTQVTAPRGAQADSVVGSGGLNARMLSLEATPEPDAAGVAFRSVSGRQSFALLPQESSQVGGGQARLAAWSVSSISMTDEHEDDPAARHLVLAGPRGREYIRLARVAAQVSDNVRDDLMHASVGLIRRGEKSVDLVLFRGRWVQSDDRRLWLERGRGYVTILNTGEAIGWSDGRSRDVEVWLGEDAPGHPTLQVDGQRRGVTVTNRRATFTLPRGSHGFQLK